MDAVNEAPVVGCRLGRRVPYVLIVDRPISRLRGLVSLATGNYPGRRAQAQRLSILGSAAVGNALQFYTF